MLPRCDDGIDGLLTRGVNQGKRPAEADRETGGEAEDAGARAGEHAEQTERGERHQIVGQTKNGAARNASSREETIKEKTRVLAVWSERWTPGSSC